MGVANYKNDHKISEYVPLPISPTEWVGSGPL